MSTSTVNGYLTVITPITPKFYHVEPLVQFWTKKADSLAGRVPAKKKPTAKGLLEFEDIVMLKI
jgi:hypothetical protein